MKRLIGSLIGLAMFVGACSSSEPQTVTPADPTPEAEEPTPEPTATPEPEPTATPELEPTATPDVPNVDEAVEVWQQFITIIAGSPEDETVDERAAQYATLEVVDEVRSIPWSLQVPEVESYAKAEVQADGTVLINDCVIYLPNVLGFPSYWWQGTLSETDAGWQVTEAIQVNGISGCFPQELANEAVASYENFVDVFYEVLGNPDPDDVRIAEISTGRALDDLVSLATTGQEDGVVLRGRPDTEAVFSSFGLLPGTDDLDPNVIVLDVCRTFTEGYGAFSIESGEQVGAFRDPGETTLVFVTMVRSGDEWKVEGRNTEEVEQCDLTESSTLPLV